LISDSGRLIAGTSSDLIICEYCQVLRSGLASTEPRDRVDRDPAHPEWRRRRRQRRCARRRARLRRPPQAQHGWVYLHAIVDCCTREIAGWTVDVRCRDDEAIAVVEHAVLQRGVPAGVLTLGSDIHSESCSAIRVLAS
jgi:transposase InsO family protein